MFENTPPAGGFGQGADGFDDLDGFGDEYRPQAGFRPGIETLASGDYDFEIIDACLDRARNNDRIVKLGLQTSAGRVVEHTYWLNKQESVNRFGADMAVLGFPAQTWGKQVPLSKAIPECVARLKGVKFRATKTARDGTGLNAGKVYHDLYISCRIDGRPMPPLQPPAAQPTPNGPQRQPVGAPGGNVDPGSIPF